MRLITVAQSPKTDKYAVVSMKGQNDLYIVGDCEGETKEEVVECYRQYLLKQYQMFTSNDEQHKCEVCEKWTQTSVHITQYPKRWWLCSEHANDEQVDKLFTLPEQFEMWES